jgi:hypothetical protein
MPIPAKGEHRLSCGRFRRCAFLARGGTRPRARLTRPVPAGMVGVVLIDDARAARVRRQMQGGLGQPQPGAGYDDQRGAVHSALHPLILETRMPGRGGIVHGPDSDRLVVIDTAFLVERHGVWLGWQRVQVLVLDREAITGRT